MDGLSRGDPEVKFRGSESGRKRVCFGQKWAEDISSSKRRASQVSVGQKWVFLEALLERGRV